MNKKIAVLSCHTPSLFWFRMDMMKQFRKYGYQVHAIGNESEELWSSRFYEQGIIYHQIRIYRNGLNPINDLKSLFSIYNMLKKIQPDKVFTYQAKTVIYGGMAANALGIKEVYPLIAGLGSVFLKNDIKTAIIRRILIWEYKIGIRKCPTVFFQNNEDAQLFKSHRIIKNQKTVHIPGSGVNLEYYYEQKQQDKAVFLCVSRLIKDKGVYEYLEASRKVKKDYPDVQFWLVGPFDTNPSALSNEELQTYIEDGSVQYFGEQNDVRPFYAQCSVFVLPSYREGTPKTVLEAMACGRSVITTDAPGCKETVVDGQNGFLVPVKNINVLCDKMVYLIQNPCVRFKMGKKGRVIAEQKFDVKIVNRIICETMGLSDS